MADHVEIAAMRAGGDRDRAMEDLWERTLSQLTTTFGRLSYLASLRNANSGRYQHFGLSQIYGEDDADRVLRQSHERTFSEWLNFPLERQRDEIVLYLDEVSEDRASVLETWSTLAPYRNLAPAAAGDAEIFLYTSDLELILDLLQNELSV